MTIFEGISQRMVPTSRINVSVLERVGDDPSLPPERTLVLIHGNLCSGLIWQEIMLALPADLRVIAIDLRGFGWSDAAPIDATRGVRDFSDDIRATLDALGIPSAHMVGWSMGGGVVSQYAIDYPTVSLTFEAPLSPYGWGGTRRDGSRLTDDDAGSGGASVDPELVRRIREGDRSADAPSSPRSVFRKVLVGPGYRSEHEDVWVESMLLTSTAAGNYPGDWVASEHWPGYAPGLFGVENALAPKHHDVSSLARIESKPPLLWIHGALDVGISDAPVAETNYRGMVGEIAGWPGEAIAPPQPMLSQTRDVFDAYERAGGAVTEVLMEGVGHAPHLEQPDVFIAAVLHHIGYQARSAS